MGEVYLREILEQCRYFTTEWQLKMLSQACNWYLDIWPISFTRQKLPSTTNLLIIICQDSNTNVLIPCFFGIFPALSSAPLPEIYRRFFQVLQNKSPFPLQPSTILVDYDGILRSVVKKSFPSCTRIFGCMAFKLRMIYNESKLIKCSVLGYKTAGLTRNINFFLSYFMIISMLEPEEFLQHWLLLKTKIDEEPFSKLIHLLEQEFIARAGRFHSEMTFNTLKYDPVFRMATPAIEGYQYRFKQLMKTYNVTTLEMMIEKVIITEEKHFSSKVVEVNLNRIPKPELPEKYFFDRSMGTLPISTAVSDMFGLMENMDFGELAEKLIAANEHNALPQRKSLACLASFEEYKESLISKEVISEEVIQNYTARRKRYRDDKAIKVKEEINSSN
jgi:hypothetical protein